MGSRASEGPGTSRGISRSLLARAGRVGDRAPGWSTRPGSARSHFSGLSSPPLPSGQWSTYTAPMSTSSRAMSTVHAPARATASATSHARSAGALRVQCMVCAASGVGADASAALASSNASRRGQGDARRPDEVVSRSEARGAHRRSDEEAPGDRRRVVKSCPTSRHREDGDCGTVRPEERARGRALDDPETAVGVHIVVRLARAAVPAAEAPRPRGFRAPTDRRPRPPETDNRAFASNAPSDREGTSLRIVHRASR